MKATLMLLGACILAPFAGGLAGASINTTPLTSASDPLATIPRHDSDFTGDIAYGGLDAPDHYPLVTRHGTVPVEELMFHGALGRRYYPYAYAASDDYAERAPSSADAGPGPGDGADEGEARRAADIARLIQQDDPSAPAPALVPADPGLPAGARGMLTAVAQPAPGAPGGLTLAQ